MEVDIEWKYIVWKEDKRWKSRRVLYAYLTTDRDEILYIGKAYKNTVKEEYEGNKAFWKDLKEQRGVSKVLILVGEICCPEGKKITEGLASDVENLLVKRIKPWGNISYKDFGISRIGLRVRCVGGWHGWKNEYRNIV